MHKLLVGEYAEYKQEADGVDAEGAYTVCLGHGNHDGNAGDNSEYSQYGIDLAEQITLKTGGNAEQAK